MTLLRKTVGEIVREQARLYPAQEAYVYPEHGYGKRIRNLMKKPTNLQKHLSVWESKKGNTSPFGRTINGSGYLASMRQGKWEQFSNREHELPGSRTGVSIKTIRCNDTYFR